MLSRESIHDLIVNPAEGVLPLIQDYVSLDAQLQPNGFDLTLDSVHRFENAGYVGADKSNPSTVRDWKLDFPEGSFHLPQGNYLIRFNECVNLPVNLMALGRPRSSLVRSGVALHTGVWDAGYSGRSQCLMSVLNANGFFTQRGARLLHMVFDELDAATAGYSGQYQGENI